MSSLGGVVHGTAGCYNHHGCRCAECAHAWAEYMRGWFAERAAQTPCSVDGCDRGLYSRGMCRAHYERQRTGKPLNVQISRRPGGTGPQPGKRRVA